MIILNALTQHEYSANNQKQLHESAVLNGFNTEKVAGYNQWLEMGYQVQKGQKATSIIMVVDKKIKSKVDGKEDKKKVPKTVRVFFEDQVAKIEH